MTLSTITMVEWLTLIAVFTGPVVGVWLASVIRKVDNKRERQRQIFKTLMATRATTLSVDHVQALNRIELEFNGRGDKEVQGAWRLYHAHLSNVPSSTNQPLGEQWSKKSEDLRADLLFSMAQRLGYGDIDKAQIIQSAYYPEGHGRDAFEQATGRRLILEILSGEKALPVKITQPLSPNPQPAPPATPEDK